MKRADEFLALFRSGLTTLEIAHKYEASESGVYNMLHSVRRQSTAQRYYANNRHRLKLRRCGITESAPVPPPFRAVAGPSA
jgi:hypothetical protein